jgi:DNA-binding protein WhiA
MSFSSDVKNEVARLEGEDQETECAELFGLLRISGSVSLSGQRVGLHFATENAALARRVLRLLKDNFAVQTEVIVTRSTRLKKNNRYQVHVVPSEEARAALSKLHILSPIAAAGAELLKKNASRRSFLRGVFLAGGSVSKPISDYHLEIVSDNLDMSRYICKIMKGFDLPARIVDRKKNFIVYLKEGNAIATFLSLIGAHGSYLEFENVRVLKDMRNQVNRVVNCETANLNKTVQAAVRQIAAIRIIEQKKGLESLPEALQEAARLRLNHQELSVGELAALTEDHIGKSGLNHRLKKIEELAGKLRKESNE